MLALLIGISMTLDNKSAWIDALAYCESRGNDNAAIVDTNGYWSRGRFQFQRARWKSNGKNYSATRDNIFDGKLQEQVVREMLDKGLKNHWYWCAKRVEAKLGQYGAPLDAYHET